MANLTNVFTRYKERPRMVALDIADYFTGYRTIGGFFNRDEKFNSGSTFSLAITSAEIIFSFLKPKEVPYIIAGGEIARAYFRSMDYAADRFGSLVNRIKHHFKRN